MFTQISCYLLLCCKGKVLGCTTYRMLDAQHKVQLTPPKSSAEPSGHHLPPRTPPHLARSPCRAQHRAWNRDPVKVLRWTAFRCEGVANRGPETTCSNSTPPTSANRRLYPRTVRDCALGFWTPYAYGNLPYSCY